MGRNPHSAIRNPRSSAGFTLLEIILAVALTALIMAILYGVVVSTVEAQIRVEAEIAMSEIGPALVTQLRQDLDAILQPGSEAEYFAGIDRPGGKGSFDRIDFIASVMAFGAEDEYQEPRFHSVNEVGYQVQSNPAEPGVGILYRRLDYFVDSEPLRGGRLTELYDRVVSFDVTYFNGTEWITHWATKESEGKLPEAIKVDLKILIRRGIDDDVERTYSLTVTKD